MIIQWLLLLLTPGNHASRFCEENPIDAFCAEQEAHICDHNEDELRGQIAYPRLLESRSEKSSQVVQIDPYLTLSLERSPIFRDYIKVFDLENGAYVTKTIPSQTYSEHLRQDKTHFSSLMFYETLHGPLLTGIVNITHAIEPDIVSSRDLNGAIPHRVQRISDDVTPTLFQRQKYKDDSRISSRNGKTDKNGKSGQKGNYENQGKAKKSQKVYILEITIVTDKWAMKNIDKRARVRYEAYYATVLNAVVLRFNLLRSPVIQLKLLGVYVVPTFVTSQIVERRGFYVLETGRELAKNEKVTKALQKSDILIYATGWPKLDISRPHRLVIPTEYGFEGKVCTNMKFGYVVDEGYYQLINPLTRVIARLLGSAYDGAFEAQRCSRADRFLMSPLGPALPYAFSRCSRHAIRKFMQTNITSDCLHKWGNRDTYKKNHKKKFPGLKLSPIKLCNRILPKVYKARSCTSRFFVLDSCSIQCCVGEKRSETIITRDALDGMDCRKYGTWRKMSRRGECYNGGCVLRSISAEVGEGNA